MAVWRVVNSITTLRLQLDAAFPGRSHASDGTIGDENHSSSSDHTPHRYPSLGPTPVVCAFDGTHDPAHGCDNNVITESIRLSRDARVKYLIWNRRMYSSYQSSGVPAWTWRPYTGSDDPHTNHFHLSVVAAAIADDTSPWAIGVEDDMDTVDRLRLKLVYENWAPTRAEYVAAGGSGADYDTLNAGGSGRNALALKLADLQAGQVKLADGLAALTAKVDALAAALEPPGGAGNVPPSQ